MARQPSQIPKRLRERYELLVALTDRFCDLHLTEEFKELCRKLVRVVCEEGFAVNTGKPVGWAAGIVHAIGWVSFLDDKSQTPHMSSADMAKAFGISQPTMMAKSVLLRKGLGLAPQRHRPITVHPPSRSFGKRCCGQGAFSGTC